MTRHADAESGAPMRSPAGRLVAQLTLASRFYLGLGAPATRRVESGLRIVAAAGYSADLVRRLVALRRGEDDAGTVEAINFRSTKIAARGDDRAFFVKDFPRGHALNDLEQALRCSRIDRAWRAAHLLPPLGLLTPAPVGRASLNRGPEPMEYLVTAWVPDCLSYHLRLRTASGDARARMLHEFARNLRRWHDAGVYLRDLVTNVLTRESPAGLEYWLTDLDQLHPYRRITRGRLFHQMRQLARWTGPLTQPEAALIVSAYLGNDQGRLASALQEILLTTPPAEAV
jgi:hypothetical protein